MGGKPDITLTIDGPSGNARFADFAQVLESLNNTLKHICRCIVNDSKVTYEVTELRHGSGTITVTPVSKTTSAERFVQVADVLESSLAAIESGADLDPRLDYATLEATLGFAKAAKKKGVTLIVANVPLTKSWAAGLDRLLASDTCSSGSVAGTLETVSVHGKHSFTLYPPILKESIKCEMKPEDLPKALDLVGQTVTVHGTMYYSKAKVFPTRVVVETFESHPDSDTLPTLLAWHGQLSGRELSVEHVRSIRDEWE